MSSTQHDQGNVFLDAFFPSGVTVEKVTKATEVVVRLTPDAADRLYNDIYAVSRDLDIHNTAQRGERFPALFALYDALFEQGVDGTGSVSA